MGLITRSNLGLGSMGNMGMGELYDLCDQQLLLNEKTKHSNATKSIEEKHLGKNKNKEGNSKGSKQNLSKWKRRVGNSGKIIEPSLSSIGKLSVDSVNNDSNDSENKN